MSSTHSALWAFTFQKSTLPISSLKMPIVQRKKNCHEAAAAQLQDLKSSKIL